MTISPYTFTEARQNMEDAARLQRQAEDGLRDAAKDLAAKERAYRQALAERILEAHAQEVAWSVAADIARGDKHVSDLRFNRDVSKGVHEAAQHALWRHAADRRTLDSLINWSQRRELAEAGPQPEWSRAAA